MPEASATNKLIANIAAVTFGYLLIFSLLCYPLFAFFSSAPWGNCGDELQALWNMWWVKHAVLDLHISPWSNTWIHFPLGMSMFPHPLAPTHGLIYIAASPFMSIIEAHNSIVILGFVLTGVCTYFLARELKLQPIFSFFAGCLFTFSNFHFQHLHGHLEFVSLQWLPLYFLLLHRFLRLKTTVAAALCSAALFLICMSNLYFLLDAAIGSLIFLVFEFGANRRTLWKNLPALKSLAVFALSSLLTTGVYGLGFLLSIRSAPLLRGHDPALGSLHPIEIFIPGRFWQFSHLSASVWENLQGYEFEHSVALGFGCLGFMLVSLCSGMLKGDRGFLIWAGVFVVFLWLSLGPEVFVGTDSIALPFYNLIDFVFPISKLSGLPIRFFVMCVLAAALLAGLGLQILWQKNLVRSHILATVLGLLCVIEALPTLPTSNLLTPPKYISDIRSLSLDPGQGLLDLAHNGAWQLYIQTLHERPMTFGYTARITRVADKQNRTIKKLFRQGNYKRLCKEFQLRYVLIKSDSPLLPLPLRQVFSTDGVSAYELCSEF